MALWIVRGGKHGENETYALENSLVSIGWEGLGNLSEVNERQQLQGLVERTYPDASLTTARIWTGEVWAVRSGIQIGDLVAIPLKTRGAVAIGRVTGPYRFDPQAPFDAKHQRQVRWIRTDIARTELDQDILFSLGSTLAVFQVRRNNAEQRIAAFLEGRQANEAVAPGVLVEDALDEERGQPDLAQVAADQIADFIGRKFRGHEMARLVGAILDAQGYKTRVSPQGADGGVDIIAGGGAMGFDPPRIAVQVKSSDSPIDVSALRELQGVMPRFGAEQGLIVSWGGFKESVIREARQLFFQVRLWDGADLVAALQDAYDRLSPEIQSEFPLRRIWTLVTE